MTSRCLQTRPFSVAALGLPGRGSGGEAVSGEPLAPDSGREENERAWKSGWVSDIVPARPLRCPPGLTLLPEDAS